MSADSGSLTMELAKSLVENLDFGDVDRIWEHSRWEQSNPCGALPEADDGFSGPVKDARKALEPIPGRIHEQSPLLVPQTGVMAQLSLFPEPCDTGDNIRVRGLRIPRNSRRFRRSRCRP